MAKLCIKCVKGWINEIEIGDVVVKKEDCSNCLGDDELSNPYPKLN